MFALFSLIPGITHEVGFLTRGVFAKFATVSYCIREIRALTPPFVQPPFAYLSKRFDFHFSFWGVVTCPALL